MIISSKDVNFQYLIYIDKVILDYFKVKNIVCIRFLSFFRLIRICYCSNIYKILNLFIKNEKKVFSKSKFL